MARRCGLSGDAGLINTHHHLYQTLTWAVLAVYDALLFGWLKTLYPIWARMGAGGDPRLGHGGLAELALSGCTLTSIISYLYPNGARLDDTIDAAREVDVRAAGDPRRHVDRRTMAVAGQSGRGRGGDPQHCIRDRRLPRPAPRAMIQTASRPVCPSRSAAS